MTDILQEYDGLIGSAISIGVVTVAVVTTVMKVWPIVRKLTSIINDMAGEPPRPGFDGRPGIMERLQKVESDASDAAYHVKPNHGSSAHDDLKTQLDRVETHVNVVGDRVDRLSEESKHDRQRLWEQFYTHHGGDQS